MPVIKWNAGLYDDKHSFVSQYGEALISWLKPQEGERILDLGCGTGKLANEIAGFGAVVTGIDASAEMINKAKDVEVWIVPGSKQVEKQAIEEGIDKIFEEAGFILRQPGCSACLGMNEDKIPAGKYCISTSNRNFEGRQGPNARTFLASPLTAAAAAITGEVTDVREMML